MENIIAYKTFIVLLVFLLFFMLEHIRPATPPAANNGRRNLKNALFWPLNAGMSVLFVIPLSYFAADHALWARPDWLRGAWSILADIFLLDLFIYFWHRALHELPVLWRFHEVHHLDEHLDTTSALRFHFGEVAISALVRGILIIAFAVPFTSVVLFETMILACTFFHHSNIGLPARLEEALSKFIITPSIHWVHHHALRKDTDSNYGTIFSFWDRLLGTNSSTARFLTMQIGVEGKKDIKFTDLLIAPFIKLPTDRKN